MPFWLRLRLRLRSASASRRSLSGAEGSGSADASYTYNAQGQRASKTTGGIITYFVYSDLDGQLLGEYNAGGQPIREYIYLEGERVAMYDYSTVEPKDSSGQKAIVYLHNNQVGQVQYAFNSDGQMIYERIQTPFGETMGELNAYNLHMPVRFPGQYYDSETGFNQNWNREYDPSLGRYVQSDPIGLNGGINTYGYVGQNPVYQIDLLGLASLILSGGYNLAIGPFGGGFQGGIGLFDYKNAEKIDGGIVNTFQRADGWQGTGGVGFDYYYGGRDSVDGYSTTELVCFEFRYGFCVSSHRDTGGRSIGWGFSVGGGIPGGFSYNENNTSSWTARDAADWIKRMKEGISGMSTPNVPDDVLKEFCRQNPGAPNCKDKGCN